MSYVYICRQSGPEWTANRYLCRKTPQFKATSIHNLQDKILDYSGVTKTKEQHFTHITPMSAIFHFQAAGQHVIANTQDATFNQVNGHDTGHSPIDQSDNKSDCGSSGSGGSICGLFD